MLFRSGTGRFRVNLFRQRGSIAAVVRVIRFGLPTAEEAHIPPEVMRAAQMKKGIVLVTGSAGSGKSTTLACIINEINRTRTGHILTLEDPVEYIHRHDKCIVSQREIGCDCPSYVAALRSALRESPDVILLGEMRDKETMEVAMTAAETGQLLLSSLHTTGAANTIDLSTEGSVTLTAPGNQSGKMIGGKLSITSGTKKETGTYYESYENYDGEYDGSSKTILKFVHETTTPMATVDDVTITGTTGAAIIDKDVVITLTNDTFKSTLSGDWITNLPTNLSQSVSKTDDTHAKITVSGNPSETSSAPLIIKIPAANLVTSTSDLDVTSNTKAKFAITAPTYSVNIVAGANMSTSDTASQSGLTGAMTEVVYTADTGYYFPTDYSSVGTSDGVTVKRDSYTQITVSGTPTGTVNITLADATAKTKET